MSAPPWHPVAGDLWLVHGSMAAVVQALDEDGAERMVALRIGARRNLSDDQLDATLVLELDRAVGLIAGVLSAANEAYGRQAVHEAMARALSMDQDAVRETKARLADRLREEL